MEITVPEANKNYRGSGFKMWDAFVTDFFEKHPDRKNDNTSPANKDKRKKGKKNER